MGTMVYSFSRNARSISSTACTASCAALGGKSRYGPPATTSVGSRIPGVGVSDNPQLGCSFGAPESIYE